MVRQSGCAPEARRAVGVALFDDERPDVDTILRKPAIRNEARTASGAPRSLRIAVVGSGISGLSAAWLLSRRHEVTLFEGDGRVGGHIHTVEVAGTPVDTGFIVYNETTYPNLTALFRHLGVATRPSEMSFAVSLDDGRLEYSSNGLGGLFAQPRNLASRRFWSMLIDLVRFYRQATRDVHALEATCLGDYLAASGYSTAFREDHLYPMAAAIWSTPAAEIGSYPAAAFIRFCDNHGLLKLAKRPVWRTVVGGSRAYVQRLTDDFAGRIETGRGVRNVRRLPGGVDIVDSRGRSERFDHVVIATHADQALHLLADPSAAERQVLGAFRYTRNEAVLHADPSLMPKRRSVWSSWNYGSEGDGKDRRLSVTYWMNRLQAIPDATPLFVTLNPTREPAPATVFHRQIYEHPTFDTAAFAAQDRLWSLQGVQNTWFCGSYFGAGFHEDGLQAGLAAAEALGDVRRPWRVAAESARIHIRPPALQGSLVELPA
jgi:predicted NAD/FAD-binding protein